MSLSHSKIFRLACLRLQFFSTIISMNNWYFVPREPFLHPFCSTDSEPFWLRYAYTSSATIRSLKVVGKHAIGLKSPTFGAFVSSFISKLVLLNTIESWTFPVVRQLWRNSAIRLGNACTSSELPIFLFHHHSVFSIPVEFALSSLIYVWRFFLQDGSRWICSLLGFTFSRSVTILSPAYMRAFVSVMMVTFTVTITASTSRTCSLIFLFGKAFSFGNRTLTSELCMCSLMLKWFFPPPPLADPEKTRLCHHFVNSIPSVSGYTLCSPW